jgi:hypothetical protein
MQQAAEAIVRENVDAVIVASNELARAMSKATTTVPVVFVAVTDPEEEGLVASVARPGGNITGLSHMTGELAGKRVQLLKDALPKLRRVAVLATQKTRPTEHECFRLGLDVQLFAAPEPGDIGPAFAVMRRARPEALFVVPHPMFWLERRRIVTLASEIGVPAIYENKDFVTSGGLPGERTACKAAGTPGRIPHDFRRTAVRNLERAGVPRSVAMKMVGHKTEAIYRRYAIVSDADLQDAAKKLAAANASGNNLVTVVPVRP